ncbi:MAG: flavin reductase family protein [Nocardioidaceae bacterium]
MTIHSEHPFLPPEDERNPLRRLRARLGAPVTLWLTGEGRMRAGLTVSSLLVVDGEPGGVLGLLDPDSDLWETIRDRGTFTVCLLSYQQRALADAFAGVAPAPGGAFRMATWDETQWGPALAGSSWIGCRLEPSSGREYGWSVLAEGVAEHVEIGIDEGPLLHRRGRYHRLG